MTSVLATVLETEAAPDAAASLRIVHLLAPAPFGGLERVVESLALEQAGVGHEVHVVTVVGPGTAEPTLIARLRARGVFTHPLVMPGRAYRRERRVVADLLRRIAPDVVHTHGYRPDVLHGPVARRLGIPAVTTVHGFMAGDLKNRLYERLQRRAFRKFDAVVAVSRPMAAGLAESGIAGSRIHCIPNAYADPVSFLDRRAARTALDLAQDAFLVGFIGRVGSEKGPDIFVEAIFRLAGLVSGVVIGDGRLKPQLEQRARDLGLGDFLRWMGVVEDAARHIKAFDVMVLSSRTEGTPIVLLEAMAAGVPVVASRVGGIPYVVSDREARLVEPNNPAALADAVRDALEKPMEARATADRAAERLRSEFGPEAWVRRYTSVYRACMNPAPSLSRAR